MFFDINGDMKTDILLTDQNKKMIVLEGQDSTGINFVRKEFHNYLVSNDDDPEC